MKRTDSAAIAFLVFLAGLIASTCPAAVSTWDGSDSSDWFDPANWSAGVPGTADDAVVPNVGNDVLLTNSTAALASFTITGKTLTFSNWTTVLTASNVTIQTGSTITLPGSFTDSQMSNRVHIVCTNFTLAAGAVVDADEAGFQGGTDTSGAGYGPGAGGCSSYYGGGGGHGGRGGNGSNDAGANSNGGGGRPYGSTNAPVAPGSGGGGNGPNDGGGAVRINASGTVTVNGTITADGAYCTAHGGGGSGGSIYITCDTFAGTATGLLSANGGFGGTTGNRGGGGGGGRIAVVYQAVGVPWPSVRFTVAPGASNYQAGEVGTLYVPDGALLSETLANLLNVRIYGITNWSVSHLAMTNCEVWLATDGLTMSVTNAIRVDTGAGLTLGGASTLNCDGVVLTNGGYLAVHGGIVGTPTDYGSLVSISNDLAVGPGSWVYPYAHPTNGGSPLFRAANVAVSAGGGFDGSGRGFDGGTYSRWDGYGPGYGLGGANVYYGVGGNGSGGAGGIPYGESNAPVQPGSGGASWSGGHGGSSVRIQASGTVSVDGTIRVDADDGGEPGQGLEYGSGGSGGGVFITCGAFSGAASALISADGGDSGWPNNAGGGGGRIAIGIGISAFNIAKLIAGQPVFGLTVYDSYVPYLGALSVTNGVNSSGARGGAPGTAQFMQVMTGNTYTLDIAGAPGNYDSPGPRGYGPYVNIDSGTWITNSVTSPADEAAGERWACTGWAVVDDLSALVTNGTSTQAVFQVETNVVLTWYWTNEFELAVTTGPNGGVNAGAVNGWYTNGVEVSGILATSAPGYAFHQWTGSGVPPDQESVNPLTVTMNQARAVMANFYSLTGVTRTWAGGTGDWAVPVNWSPSGVPELLDDVVIGSGSVTVDSPKWVSSVSVANATVTLTNWTTALHADEVTLGVGATLTLPPAFTESQMSNRVHVVCSNFTMDVGAQIDADGKGFSGGAGIDGDGNGPGKGLCISAGYYGGGAGHGGNGGRGSGGLAGGVYGSTSAPVVPGSGGGGNGSGHGGGAVRIEATGTATVNGTIDADGADPAAHGGGGSGGSIYITCRTLAGSSAGLLTVNGGSNPRNYGSSGGGGGGGGRLAVVYDPVAQAGAPKPGVRFSSVPGSVTVSARPGELGTGYMPDAAVLSPTLANFYTLRLYGITNWSVASVSMGSNDLWLAEEALQLTVANDMMLDAGAQLALPPRVALHCGGDLVLTNGGRLTVHSGPTNGAVSHGSLVSITNDVTIGTASWIHPDSGPLNGGSPLFAMADLTIATNGGFDGTGGGYAAGTLDHYNGYGPGLGLAINQYYGGGGAYGGAGGNGTGGTGGQTYGSSNAPVHAGSGGASRAAGRGGAGVRIEARGTVRLDGVIRSDGADGGLVLDTYGGGGSGGGVFLVCRSFSGGTDGLIAAEGGDGGHLNNGSGGGGRIAVWYGISAADRQELLAGNPVDGLSVSNGCPTFLGAVSVSNGTSNFDGDPGTVLFLSTAIVPRGTLLIIR